MFGHLKVLMELPDRFYTSVDGRTRNDRLVKCSCSCGKEIVMALRTLKSGAQSCSCLARRNVDSTSLFCGNPRNRSHGMCYTKTYKSWYTMRQRCLNVRNKRYYCYGGRGIAVCDEWHKFENFYKDMGERPEGKSLDRIDNNKGYFKENCRWATREEQANNKSNNVRICYNGKSKTIAQWSAETGIGSTTISERMKRGWDVSDLFSAV